MPAYQRVPLYDPSQYNRDSFTLRVRKLAPLPAAAASAVTAGAAAGSATITSGRAAIAVASRVARVTVIMAMGVGVRRMMIGGRGGSVMMAAGVTIYMGARDGVTRSSVGGVRVDINTIYVDLWCLDVGESTTSIGGGREIPRDDDESSTFPRAFYSKGGLRAEIPMGHDTTIGRGRHMFETVRVQKLDDELVYLEDSILRLVTALVHYLSSTTAFSTSFGLPSKHGPVQLHTRLNWIGRT
ncbi:15905_t:CDS:2 [Acaulospora colombiana]|uniref:15905_t:CDS:1 n=1 Tax=Acaulospora colombiana TaxID=27376 RepID=A0ACA9N3N0_9GLOM|nr:15905_t:CDS:2 [Acaulospora colombiana]